MKCMIPVVVALLLAGAACSDEEASPVCDARDELETSVQELRDIDILDDGLDTLRSDLDAVSDDLATLRAEAGDELAPQVEAFRGALDDVRAMVDSGGSPAEVATSIGAGLSDLATTGNELIEAARGLCE